MTTQRIRVLLVDDHKILRDGLKALIESEADMCIVGEADSGEDALLLFSRTQPDVVVMDLGMPGMGGLTAIQELRNKKADCRIVVLSMHSDREVVTQALRAGCNGFVPKSSAHTRLLHAIRTVHAGETYLHAKAISAMVNDYVEKEKQAVLLESLSEREREVIRLTALGYTSREIGDRLAISPKTVETYRQRGMTKLELDHRSDVVRFAIQAGLLNDIIGE
jgi:two-component system response regulator NreC